MSLSAARVTVKSDRTRMSGCRLLVRRHADVVKADTIVLGAAAASVAERRDEADPRRYRIRCWAAGD